MNNESDRFINHYPVRSNIVEPLKHHRMNTNAPIKRTEVLKPLSHEHHHGLLLCWKIKTGIKKNIDAARIKKYADWFYRSHLY